MNAKVVPRVCTVGMAATENEVALEMMSRNTCLMLISSWKKFVAEKWSPWPARAAALSGSSSPK